MSLMKKILILVTLLGALSANSRTKSVERPVYVVTNQTTLDIEKVELTDSATASHSPPNSVPGGGFSSIQSPD